MLEMLFSIVTREESHQKGGSLYSTPSKNQDSTFVGKDFDPKRNNKTYGYQNL